jgi:hypothetical protein
MQMSDGFLSSEKRHGVIFVQINVKSSQIDTLIEEPDLFNLLNVSFYFDAVSKLYIAELTLMGFC